MCGHMSASLAQALPGTLGEGGAGRQNAWQEQRSIASVETALTSVLSMLKSLKDELAANKWSSGDHLDTD